jgi:ABC-type multidrug transport system ATPase subunit
MNAVKVDIENLSIHLLQSDREIGKTLLHPVNAVIDGGSLFAILGGSGSGKTSLLNVIAGRYDRKSFKIGGSIVLGEKYSGDIGYVTQQDFLLPFLTVKETITFAAKLKIGRQSDYDSPIIVSIDKIVSETILDLGLKECSDTRIGDDSQAFGARGISGGEKRRVSIACQIITNPRVLCADEPTSGKNCPIEYCCCCVW